MRQGIAPKPWLAAEPTSVRHERPDLSDGTSGLALLHAVLAIVTGSRMHRDLAERHLRDAAETLNHAELNVGFFEGFCGVVWMANFARRHGIRPVDWSDEKSEQHLTRVDDVCAGWLLDATPYEMASFENGMGSLAAYAFERGPTGQAARLGRAVLECAATTGTDAWAAHVGDHDVIPWSHVLHRAAGGDWHRVLTRRQQRTLVAMRSALDARLRRVAEAILNGPRRESSRDLLELLRATLALHDRRNDVRGPVDDHVATALVEHAARSLFATSDAPASTEDRLRAAYTCARLAEALDSALWSSIAGARFASALSALSSTTAEVTDRSMGVPFGRVAAVLHLLPAVAHDSLKLIRVLDLGRLEPTLAAEAQSPLDVRTP